jgi:hypothetical protein
MISKLPRHLSQILKIFFIFSKINLKIIQSVEYHNFDVIFDIESCQEGLINSLNSIKVIYQMVNIRISTKGLLVGYFLWWIEICGSTWEANELISTAKCSASTAHLTRSTLDRYLNQQIWIEWIFAANITTPLSSISN